MEKFYCRNDIIEYLYKLQEYIYNREILSMSEDDFGYILHSLSFSIPKSKYFDEIVGEFLEEVQSELQQLLLSTKSSFNEVPVHAPTYFNKNAVILH